MRLLSVLVALCLTAPAAAAPSVNITDVLQHIPQCALPCIVSNYLSSPSVLADPRSSCTNNTLQRAVASCVLPACSLEDQIKLASTKQELCKGIEVESRVWVVGVAGIVTGALSFLAVGLRCYSRFWLLRKLGADDWLAVAAAVLIIPILGLQLYGGFASGYGRHVWDIEPHNIPALQKNFYAGEILYIFTITLVKASILLFYLRVFTSKWFIILDYVTLGLVIASGVAILFAIVFQCTPIAGVWNASIPHSCVNINTLSYGSGAISVVLDIIIIALPIPALVGLQMNIRKKVGLVLMFSVGSLACITSMIRLKYLVAFTNSTDQTWDNAYPTIWSNIEICVALVCACLPAIRAFLSTWFPKVFNLSTTPDSYQHSTPNAIKTPYGNSSTITSTIRAEKSGPSYNKRVITSPDDEILAHSPASTDSFPHGILVSRETETKIWVKTAPTEEGDDGFRVATNNTSQTSLWALEGERISDEEERIGQEGTVMKPLPAAGQGRKERNLSHGSFRRLLTPEQRGEFPALR